MLEGCAHGLDQASISSSARHVCEPKGLCYSLQMSKTVELFYDFSSPNAYFAAMQVPKIAQHQGAKVRFRPFLLGALFKSLGREQLPSMATPARAKHDFKDLQRWSKKHGIPFNFASRFPLNTVKPLRLVLAVEAAGLDPEPLTLALYQRYWVDDKDISDDSVLEAELAAWGLPSSLLEETQSPEIKQALKENTAEAERRGCFGAPTCIVGEEVFFGKDRLDFVADALE